MNLKNLLQQHGKTQVSLGAYLGLSPSRINLWCGHGYPVPEKHLEKIAKFLGIQVEQIERFKKHSKQTSTN